MKTKIGILVLAFSTSFFSLQAQRTVTTARALSYDISDNLNLDAVASIFGESENLEDFEYRLNDPETRISNLDLNQDGYVDYLRVIETSTDRNSMVVVQAVLDKDIYQDVATIEIEKISSGKLRVQIVGDSYIYGSNYIIQPVFVRTPLIFSFFWRPRYHSYYSPYYWNYYPSYYSYCRPYSPFNYHRHIDVHINSYNTYYHTSSRSFHLSGDRFNHIRRNDYASRYPDRAFENRNKGVKNSYELSKRQPNTANHRESSDINPSNNRTYQYNSKSYSGRNESTSDHAQYRRPSSNTQSGSSQRNSSEVGTSDRRQYQYNRNSDAGSYETQRKVSESKRSAPTIHTESNQILSRSNNSVRSNSSGSGVQTNSGARERTYSRPSVTATQPATKSAPQASSSRVQAPSRSKVSSGSPSPASNSTRSNSTVRSTQKVERSQGTSNNSSTNNNTDRRRTR